MPTPAISLNSLQEYMAGRRLLVFGPNRIMSSGATSSMREAWVTGTPYTPNLGMEPLLTAVIVRPDPTEI